jgi:hypothetical protein
MTPPPDTAPPAPAKPYDHELAARFDAIVEHG